MYLNKEVCFKCYVEYRKRCPKGNGYVPTLEKEREFFENNWGTNTFCLCRFFDQFFPPWGIPENCPYAVEQLVNQEEHSHAK